MFERWETITSPCCSGDDLLRMVIPDDPISAHSIFPGSINPSINLNDVSPIVALIRHGQLDNEHNMNNSSIFYFL